MTPRTQKLKQSFRLTKDEIAALRDLSLFLGGFHEQGFCDTLMAHPRLARAKTVPFRGELPANLVGAPLLTAVAVRGTERSTRLMLRLGADPTRVDESGRTVYEALRAARKSGAMGESESLLRCSWLPAETEAPAHVDVQPASALLCVQN
jgi:hypothetical protein